MIGLSGSSLKMIHQLAAHKYFRAKCPFTETLGKQFKFASVLDTKITFGNKFVKIGGSCSIRIIAISLDYNSMF